MAGGVAALGGIVAVPAIALIAISAHTVANQDITKTVEALVSLDKRVGEIRKLQSLTDFAEARAWEIKMVLVKARAAFMNQYAATHARLFRWGWWSRAWRWLRDVFGASYFSPPELEDVQKLLQLAASVAEVLDQPVFEHDGSVKQA